MTLKELTNKIKTHYDSWDSETKEIVDELWNRMEAAETDLEVFELRVKKQWPTSGSNLYTEDEVSDIQTESFDKGSEAGRYGIIS